MYSDPDDVIPRDFDPADPIVPPLRLLPTDVITVNPHTGERGEWTFLKSHDLGVKVALDCLAADHRTRVKFMVDRPSFIHVAPRGQVAAFWGAA